MSTPWYGEAVCHRCNCRKAGSSGFGPPCTCPPDPIDMSEAALLRWLNEQWAKVHHLEDQDPLDDNNLALRQKLLKDMEPYAAELQRRGL